MIDPIRDLLSGEMGLDVCANEFSAGYGVADLVGAELCSRACEQREKMGVAVPLDHHHLIEVLLTLRIGVQESWSAFVPRLSMSESTLRKRVLPRLKAYGVIDYASGRFVRLHVLPPPTAKYIVAVEAKQTRWKDAILQARRYSCFADQSYIAVWQETIPRVDRRLLYERRLGLIAVQRCGAQIAVEAPLRRPRKEQMRFYCSEFLYGRALGAG